MSLQNINISRKNIILSLAPKAYDQIQAKLNLLFAKNFVALVV